MYAFRTLHIDSGAEKNVFPHVRTDPNFWKKIVTGDEMWCFAYDPEMKPRIQNGLQKGPPAEKTAVLEVKSEDDIGPFFSITKALSTRNSFPRPNCK